MVVVVVAKVAVVSRRKESLPAKTDEGGEAVFEEVLEAGALDTTHGLDHGPVEAHLRCHHFGVVTENVGEVNVEEAALVRQHYVVHVTVTHSQQIRNHTVSRCAN